MKYLLDASALIPLLLDLGEKVLEIATKAQLYATDLTLYEIGNGLWKLVALLKVMDLEDALELMDVVQVLVAKEFLKVVSYRELDLKKALELAIRERLTLYDTTYIIAAVSLNATLVTEDERLRDKASKYVATTTYTSFKQRALTKVDTLA